MTDIGIALLQLARQAIGHRLFEGGGAFSATQPDLPELREPGASFVTLMRNRQLRGCIGTLQAYRPLHEDVCDNACKAAFHDPRFSPLEQREWTEIRVEISHLSAPQPLRFRDEADALAQLCPGVDGVIFAAAGRRSTFLPQVWEQLPQPHDFMAQLKMKAGLPRDFWSAEVRLELYRVRKWKERPT